MHETVYAIYLALKITVLIFFVQKVSNSIKAERKGNHLEAIYHLGWAILLYTISTV